MFGGLEDVGETEENLNEGSSVFGAPSDNIEAVFGCCCFDGKKAGNGFGALLSEGVTLLVGGNTEGARSDELVIWASAGLKEKGGCMTGCFDCGENSKGAVNGFDS